MQVTRVRQLGIGRERLGDLIFPLSTTAEVFRKAADGHRRRRRMPRTRRRLDLRVKLARWMPGGASAAPLDPWRYGLAVSGSRPRFGA